jgi:hypothetical protein
MIIPIEKKNKDNSGNQSDIHATGTMRLPTMGKNHNGFISLMSIS